MKLEGVADQREATGIARGKVDHEAKVATIISVLHQFKGVTSRGSFTI